MFFDTLETMTFNNQDYTQILGISPYVREIVMQLNDEKTAAALSDTEKIYYLLKLTYEIHRYKCILASTTNVMEAQELTDRINIFRNLINKIGGDLKTSSLFGEVVDDPDLDNHPFVKSLESSKMSGLSYEEAAEKLCRDLRVSPVTFSNFAEENQVAYPIIDNKSADFLQGNQQAKVDATSSSIAKAYRWAERYVDGRPGSIDNFIAGYLQAYKATNEELERERKKMLIKRYGGQEDADSLMTKRLEAMARNHEI